MRKLPPDADTPPVAGEPPLEVEPTFSTDLIEGQEQVQLLLPDPVFHLYAARWFRSYGT